MSKRRLTTILAADVVGYSRLMAADEEATLKTLRTYRAVFGELVDKHGGRIVNTAGDAILAEFGSTVEAVRCATSIQEDLAVRNAELPGDRQMWFRIGINVGDVIAEGDDIFGDGVNVAARLEGLAEKGGICISGSTFEQVRNKLSIAFTDIGLQSVKNIPEPVRAFRAMPSKVSVAGGVETTAGKGDPSSEEPARALTLPDKPSIAVLPFENLSGDPEQEYFSDGMAEDLITDVSKISGVYVVSRTSSFAFKGRSVDINEIARKLGVDHIVEGSVRKMGDRLRVNAQLIDCANGRHLWAERYDGSMAEIFEFQDNIREQIVAALQVNLTPSDRVLSERKPTNSVEAYDLFLKGRAQIYLYTPENFIEARESFERAIKADANFAEAYGFLALCHYYGWVYRLPGFGDNLDRANELAERGVALDGTSAIALTRLGWIQTFMRRYEQAISNFEKALALAPENAEVRATFGNSLNYWGDPDRGLELIETAFSLDPFAPPLWEYYAGISHYLLRNYDEAIARQKRAIKRTPKLLYAYLYVACSYVELDRIDEARDVIRTLADIAPDFSVEQFMRNVPWRLDEDRDRLLDGLRKAGMR